MEATKITKEEYDLQVNTVSQLRKQLREQQEELEHYKTLSTKAININDKALQLYNQFKELMQNIDNLR